MPPSRHLLPVVSAPPNDAAAAAERRRDALAAALLRVDPRGVHHPPVGAGRVAAESKAAAAGRIRAQGRVGEGGCGSLKKKARPTLSLLHFQTLVGQRVVGPRV